MLHGRDSVRWVMSCALFSPDIVICIQAKEFNFFVTSDHKIFCLMTSVFHMPSCKLQVCCHVPFSCEWLPFGHSPIKPRLVKCCRNCSPISTKELCSVRVGIGFLVISLFKVHLGQKALWCYPVQQRTPLLTPLWTQGKDPYQKVLY